MNVQILGEGWSMTDPTAPKVEQQSPAGFVVPSYCPRQGHLRDCFGPELTFLSATWASYRDLVRGIPFKEECPSLASRILNCLLIKPPWVSGTGWSKPAVLQREKSWSWELAGKTI